MVERRFSSDKAVFNDGIFERRDEIKGKDKFVERWCAELQLYEDTFDLWYDHCETSRNLYRSEDKFRDQRYNLHWSNINTTLPSLYSRTPKPDVRQRYADPLAKDEAARIAAQLLERNLVVSMDGYDVDAAFTDFVRDGLLYGRGVVRVRHNPRIVDNFIFNEVRIEPVPATDFLTGPGTRWEDIKWIAFRHTLDRDQLTALNPRIGPKVPLDYTVNNIEETDHTRRMPEVWKRAEVYEIWDKESREVIWLSKSYKEGPISVREEQMGLMDFWPVPKPYFPHETGDTLVPIVPAEIIKHLLAELEDVTTRIQRLIRVIKWRGFCDPTLNVVELESAQDGELVPAGETIMPLIQAGGLDRAIWLMPIDQAIATVQALAQQREATKQLIFEVTGISDVLRGQSDPNETLGAQEIKAQFGTLRIQHQQKMVQRVCRDALRMVAEIMCSHYDIDELMKYGGIKLMSQTDKQLAQMQMQQAEAMGQQLPVDPKMQRMLSQPTAEEVEQIIRNDVIRTYKIDIETDSTIQQDMRQVQTTMAEFLNGTAAYLQSVGPLVAEGMMTQKMAVDLYLPFARSFHLGKSAEDALEEMSAQIEAAGQQPDQPDPAEQQAQAQQAALQAEVQAQQAKDAAAVEAQQAKAQVDIQKAQQLVQIELQKLIDAHELDKRHKAELNALDLQHKSASAEIDLDQQQATAVVSTANTARQGRMKLDEEQRRSQMRADNEVANGRRR